ncbi:tyrosine-type recombinase/integrase [Halorubellus sp. JP-L1]|uniref:tyrosine-type recombinase/integrase n=1 Tax=Halorubellus sp. JP-L1 TaxID=2715753 RepID=UPI0034E95095
MNADVNEICDRDPIVDRSKRTLQNWVDAAAAQAADETGDDDYRRVSTHDLRRCWANHLLVEENVSPRIVMALGGWSSYDAIEPYLAASIEENINATMASIDL